jgi:hypothetical protein
MRGIAARDQVEPVPTMRGIRKQAGPGLGQALGAQEELPVGVQDRDKRDRHAEETAREPGEKLYAIKLPAAPGFEQRRAVVR